MSSVLAPTAPASWGRTSMRWSRDEIIARAVLLLVMGLLAVFLIAPLFTILVHAVQDRDGRFVGLAHFITYFQTPSLMRAAWNSIWVSAVVVLTDSCL